MTQKAKTYQKAMNTSFDLIAIGESLIDFISENVIQHIGNADQYQLFTGGQVTNLATNVARLGKKVALVTSLGADGFGNFLLEDLHSKGVDTTFIQETPEAATTISVISRSLRTPDFIIHRGADAYIQNTKPLLDAVRNCRIIHTSAFAMSKDPSRSTILNLLKDANEQNKLITLDPNYHPSIWPDVPDFIQILRKAFPLATITKPSIEDCHRLLGPGKTPQEYADVFKSWGAKVVIITMGEQGVFLSDQDDECSQIKPNQIEVVDVTGAGDAFWAGVITGILNGHSMLDAVRAGQVIAEIKLKKIGPIEDMPTWQQIIEDSKEIRITRC